MIVQERIFIGTPGSYYWQGQTYSQNLWNRMDLIATEEGPETEDNTYLGRIGEFLSCFRFLVNLKIMTSFLRNIS